MGIIPFDENELPTNYSWGAVGGPQFLTAASESSTHREQRVIGWRNPLRKYNLAFAVQSDIQLAALDSFFRARQGRARAFRFFDWMDFQISNQVLSPDGSTGNFPTAGTYNNVPIYRIYTFTDGAGNTFTTRFPRRIRKPIAGTAVVLANGSPLLLVNTTLTTAITQAGVQVNFSLASMAGVSQGQQITIDVGLNQETVPITAIISGVPYAIFSNLHPLNVPVTAGAFTVDTVNGYFNNLIVPNPVPTLTFSLEFDTPVMFDKDSMPKKLEAWQSSSWPLGVMEIRI